MLRQPDALQPDDQHEHQPTAGHRREERRQAAEGERPDAKQRQPEHRLGDVLLDPGERGQACHSAGEQRDHPRAAPAGRVAAVGPDPEGHRHHDQDQPRGEGEVAPPVDRGMSWLTALLELEVRPDSADQTDRHRDQEYEPPIDRRQHATEHESDEHAADADDVVDAKRHAALVLGERVGDDRRGIGQQERRADALDDAEDDQVGRTLAAAQPVDRQHQRGDRVDHEAGVVHSHAAVHVAETPQADDQHAGDDKESEDHPQQVEAVRRRQRVQMDPAEDRGHRDQRDRRVQRGEQNPEGHVGERDPLVAVAGG